MPKINLTLYPGKELKEMLDKHMSSGKKYPIGASLSFEDDKEKSGFTFFEEITFPANTKVGLTAWAGKNKNDKTVLNISIEDFEADYGKFMERTAKKKELSDSSFDKF